MANKNKTKGNANEREFCKIFGEIFEQPFQRVPNSGGMRGGLNNARSKNLSDNQKQLLENDIIYLDNTIGNEDKWIGIEDNGDVIREFNTLDEAKDYYRKTL